MKTTDNISQPTNTVSLANEEAVKKVLIDSVLGLWDVVNNLTRLRPTKHERYRVTIFGSARAKPGTVAYEETKRVSAALAEMGCDIITGGGPGLMQAANEGVKLAGEPGKSVGIRVDLPFEQEVNPFVELAFEHRTFFTRLHHFVLASDAFIVAPGGIGTVLETMMIWQLLQVRHLDQTPLILVGKMWPGLIEWARSQMLSFEPPLASAEDFNVPRCVANGDEAIALIREQQSSWTSEQKAHEAHP
jgi:uncharacterized protein (TIGR00730 family)